MNNLNLQAWIKFLASKNTFHNLCLTYPNSVNIKDYDALHEKLTLQIFQSLAKHSIDNQANFVESDTLLFKQNEELINTKDIDKLETFVNTKAYFLPCKFVLIWGPHKLSTIVSNKILKLLEDPPIALSFILLGHELTHFLDTIRSRFLNWRMQNTDLPENNFLSNLDQNKAIMLELQAIKSPQDLENWGDKFNLSESQCMDYLWNLSLPQFKSAPEIDRNLAFQQWFDRSQLWKNSAQERWYFLFQLIKNKLQSNIIRN